MFTEPTHTLFFFYLPPHVFASYPSGTQPGAVYIHPATVDSTEINQSMSMSLKVDVYTSMFKCDVTEPFNLTAFPGSEIKSRFRQQRWSADSRGEGPNSKGRHLAFKGAGLTDRAGRPASRG